MRTCSKLSAYNYIYNIMITNTSSEGSNPKKSFYINVNTLTSLYTDAMDNFAHINFTRITHLVLPLSSCVPDPSPPSTL